jgi:hypothetical protein
MTAPLGCGGRIIRNLSHGTRLIQNFINRQLEQPFSSSKTPRITKERKAIFVVKPAKTKVSIVSTSTTMRESVTDNHALTPTFVNSVKDPTTKVCAPGDQPLLQTITTPTRQSPPNRTTNNNSIVTPIQTKNLKF